MRSVLITLTLLLFFSPLSFATEVLKENWMCGNDFNGDDYLEEWELDKCVGSDSNLCPIGAVACDVNRDVFTYDASFECPETYEYNDSSSFCEKSVQSDVVRTCPVGYSLQDDVCKKLNTDTVILSCPNGYTLNDSQCKKTEIVSPTKVCASGYILNGNVCEKNEVEAFTLSCPNGYSLDGTKCKKSEQEAVTYQCPTGYALRNFTCERTDTIPANYSCPTGYSLEGDKCKKTNSTTVNLACPAGFEQNGDMCEKQEGEEALCESGLPPIDGMCIAVKPGCFYNASSYITNEFFLSSGLETWYYGGQCVLGFVCGNTDGLGANYWKGKVRVKYNIDVRPSHCGSGLNVTHYPASDDFIDVPDAKEATLGRYKHTPNNSQCFGDSNAVFYGYEICTNVETVVQATCPDGFKFEGDRCSKTTLIPISSACPSGYYRSGDNCFQNIEIDATKFCPDDYSIDGLECKKVFSTNPSLICRNGFTLSGTTCTSYFESDPEMICRDGFTLNEQRCEKKLTSDPTNACTVGYTLYGNQCTKYFSSDPNLSCKDGYTLNGNRCEQRLSTDPDLHCNNDYILNGTDCERVFSTEPNIVCPTGSSFSVSTRKCERVEEYSTCPLDGSRNSCVNDDSGTPMCSPNQCRDFNSSANFDEEGPDGTMLVDDGERTEGGACLANVYIYSGIASRCKLNGFDSAYKDCCADADAVLQDSGGQYAVYLEAGWSTIKGAYAAVKAAHDAYKAYTLVGGAASAVAAEAAAGAASDAFVGAFDPTSMAISIAVMIVMDWIANACDEMDTTTAINKASGYCHKVGTFCKKKVKFLGCIQKAEGHCCFNSKLARIIQEQGRSQLTTFTDGWGSPKSPNCRGFTPDEFQQLDFSEIDLTEYIEDLEKNTQEQLESKITEATEKFFNNIK